MVSAHACVALPCGPARGQKKVRGAALADTQKGTATPESLSHVRSVSENILTVLNGVTAMYAALG